MEACAHPFFDELRDPATCLPNGDPLPTLFDFTPHELEATPDLAPVLIPPHARNAKNWPAGLYEPASGASSESAARSVPGSPAGAGAGAGREH